MHYEKDLSHEQIAETIHISRPTVSRLLRYSPKEGIIKIRIDDISSDCLEIAKQIENKHKVRKAIVAPSSPCLEESKQNVGAAAAIYLESIIQSETLPAISWGTTLSCLVKT